MIVAANTPPTYPIDFPRHMTSRCGTVVAPNPMTSVARLSNAVSRRYHEVRTALSFNHVYGPRSIEADKDDVIIVSLVKNGATWLRAFMDHHLSLSVSHFVFVDNGSTDDTLDILRDYPGYVTVVRSLLPAKKYETLLRRQAMETFARDRWCLCVDVDELFDYPFSDAIPLVRLTRHLDSCGYTCVIAQMLDMFSDGTGAAAGASTATELAAQFPYYDLSSIEALSYHDPRIAFEWFLRSNTIASPDIRMLFGGIRKKIFDANVCLTKHPLVKVVPGVVANAHAQAASGVRCADFTALIRHYKFAGDFRERVARQVAEKTWDTGDDERYFKVLEHDRAANFVTPGARIFVDAASLVNEGFLVVSPALEALAAARRQEAPSRSHAAVPSRV